MAEKSKKQTAAVSSRVKLFRRSNLYGGEYVLLAVAGFALNVIVTILLHLALSSFVNEGQDSSQLGVMVQVLAAFIIFAPAFFWLYSRVSGEEVVRPAVRASGLRAVFLTLFLVGSVLLFLSEAFKGLSLVLASTAGVPTADINETMTGLVASLLSVGFISLVISLLIKQSSQAYTIAGGRVFALVSVLLAFVMIAGIAATKSASVEDRPLSCMKPNARGVYCPVAPNPDPGFYR